MLTKVEDKVMLTEKAYEFGKWLVEVFLPALSAAYFGLASTWGLPAAEKVVGTLAVIATFLGVCLRISSKQYDASGAAFDGVVNVLEGEDGVKVFSLEIDEDPEEIEGMDSIRFKVAKPEAT